MPRSVWKGPFVDGYLLAKAEKAAGSGPGLVGASTSDDLKAAASRGIRRFVDELGQPDPRAARDRARR